VDCPVQRLCRRRTGEDDVALRVGVGGCEKVGAEDYSARFTFQTRQTKTQCICKIGTVLVVPFELRQARRIHHGRPGPELDRRTELIGRARSANTLNDANRPGWAA
jgi:hypothetical protein